MEHLGDDDTMGEYDYGRHLKEISHDGLFVGTDGVARRQQVPPVAETSADVLGGAEEEMDDDLWAALHEDAACDEELPDDFVVQASDKTALPLVHPPMPLSALERQMAISSVRDCGPSEMESDFDATSPPGKEVVSYATTPVPSL
jgi:hypothetical protein